MSLVRFQITHWLVSLGLSLARLGFFFLLEVVVVVVFVVVVVVVLVAEAGRLKNVLNSSEVAVGVKSLPALSAVVPHSSKQLGCSDSKQQNIALSEQQFCTVPSTAPLTTPSVPAHLHNAVSIG
jgi:hypothetical protein